MYIMSITVFVITAEVLRYRSTLFRWAYLHKKVWPWHTVFLEVKALGNLCATIYNSESQIWRFQAEISGYQSIRMNQADLEGETSNSSSGIIQQHHIRQQECMHSSTENDKERNIRYALMLQWFKRVYIVIRGQMTTPAGLAMTASLKVRAGR